MLRVRRVFVLHTTTQSSTAIVQTNCLLQVADASGAVIVGVMGVRTPPKIQIGVFDTPKILVYFVTCN